MLLLPIKGYLCATALVDSHRTSPRLQMSSSGGVGTGWTASNAEDVSLARALSIWPLDELNVKLLDEVRHRNYENPDPLDVYDLVAIGSGAGGLVSSRQAARRGGKSCMISSELAGGDCLNAGCVPSKALLRCAKMIRETRKAAASQNEFGIGLTASNGDPLDGVEVGVDFGQVMRRMRSLRAQIAPVDGHDRGDSVGVQTFQGRGVFTSPTTIEVVEHGRELGDEENPTIRFRKAVIATGGRPTVPGDVSGLRDAPFTTNLNLFNLQQLPRRMVVLGAGVVALEMAQAFAAFGSEVTVLARSRPLSSGDEEASEVIRATLEKEGVRFLTGASVREVRTIRRPSSESELPLMSLSLSCNEHGAEVELDCECLLLATGRTANVEGMGLEEGGVDFHPTRGVLVNDLAQSRSNPNVYAVGDCVANVPRLTHVSGEMAKVAVQNSLFGGSWKLSSLVIPAVMYTEPEYGSVTTISVDGGGNVVPRTSDGGETDEYRADLTHNDRAILDGTDSGCFVKVRCRGGTAEVVGCDVLSSRAGEMINEVTLAMKNGIGLDGIGRNVHSYPTLGEGVMGCGLQYVNSRWETM